MKRLIILFVLLAFLGCTLKQQHNLTKNHKGKQSDTQEKVLNALDDALKVIGIIGP